MALSMSKSFRKGNSAHIVDLESACKTGFAGHLSAAEETWSSSRRKGGNRNEDQTAVHRRPAKDAAKHLRERRKDRPGRRGPDAHDSYDGADFRLCLRSEKRRPLYGQISSDGGEDQSVLSCPSEQGGLTQEAGYDPSPVSGGRRMHPAMHGNRC